MELGSSICAVMGTFMLILGGCFIRDSIRRCFIKNAANQRPTEADLIELGVGVYFSRCSHFSVPGIVIIFSFKFS